MSPTRPEDCSVTLPGRLAVGGAFPSRMSGAAQATTWRHGVRASKSQVRALLHTDLAPELFTINTDIRRRGSPELHRVAVDRDHGERQLKLRYQNRMARGLAVMPPCASVCAH
jgi:hypothetical protein